MRTISRPVATTFLVLAGVLATSMVRAQAVRPATETRETRETGVATKMEIYNGPNRTVHYFPGTLSLGEAATLRELERSENQVAYLDDLQALLRQYVNDERYLETNRKAIQDVLYGISITTGGFSGTGGSNNLGGISFGVPDNGDTGYGMSGDNYGVSSTGETTRSLANGVGDEGRLKEALVQVVAAQASPEYAAGVLRAYHHALAQAAESDRLRAVAGLSKGDGRVSPASHEQAAPVTLTLKSGEKIEGTMVGEDQDWIMLRTPKEEISIRKSEVNRITRPAPRP